MDTAEIPVEVPSGEANGVTGSGSEDNGLNTPTDLETKSAADLAPGDNPGGNEAETLEARDEEEEEDSPELEQRPDEPMEEPLITSLPIAAIAAEIPAPINTDDEPERSLAEPEGSQQAERQDSPVQEEGGEADPDGILEGGDKAEQEMSAEEEERVDSPGGDTPVEDERDDQPVQDIASPGAEESGPVDNIASPGEETAARTNQDDKPTADDDTPTRDDTATMDDDPPTPTVDEPTDLEATSGHPKEPQESLDTEDKQANNDDSSKGVGEETNAGDGSSKAAEDEATGDSATEARTDGESENTTGLMLLDPRSVTDDDVQAPQAEENKNDSSKEKTPPPDDSDVCIVGEETIKTVPAPEPKASATKTPHPCLVCKKVIKCKYNIVGNGDIRHLCDDICFKTFRSTPTQYLRSDGQQAKTPSKPEDKSKWTPKNQLCTYCTKSFTTDQFSKFEVKGGEIKPFCSSDCLKDYKAGKKVCAYCKSDVKTKKDSLLASVYDGTGMAEFCNKDCHENFVSKFTPEERTSDVQIVKEMQAKKRQAQGGNQSKSAGPKLQQLAAKLAAKAANSGQPACSVCNAKTKVKHEIAFGGKTHKLCSDACFSAFRYANKLGATNVCCYCGSQCFSEGSNPHTIQFEGQTKKFCSITCINAFKVGKTKIVPCTWCSAKKLNFDMIERVDANNTYQLFCSLNCLSLYRVNLQATSNSNIACDQCKKMSPAQYHLTMSDASVRNFCDYACVMAFQNQFSKPQSQAPTSMSESTRPTPMAQSKNTAAPTLNNSRPGSRQSSRRQQAMHAPQNSNVPVISNVMSLAGSGPAPPAGRGRGINSVNTGVGPGQSSIGSQIIIQPPPPKPVRNKALQCKPFVQTKATTCRPHTTTRETQTDESSLGKKDQVIFPIPVPIYVPMPMAMYNAPQPYPVPIPVPIPVPMFIPTTRKSADSILRHIKEIQERMPADPFEAELLMMAEAVATAGKEDSSSDSDNDDRMPAEPALESTLPTLQTVGAGGDMGEDMLSMALRMAEMRSAEDNPLDLEDKIQTIAVPPAPPPSQPEFSTIDQDSDILSATRGGSSRGGWRGGKRRRGRGTTQTNNTPRPKRSRIEETPHTEPEPQNHPASVPQPIISDENMVLKYSFGVNAWKHWVIQKNDQLEKASSGRSGRLKLFKTDLLQCTSDELNYSLCLFVKEVRKPNGDEYAPDSIYYLTLGIQQYLYENGRIDNIFADFYYEKFTECLNGILQRYEVRLNTQGLIVCRIEEEHLWECKQLGAHSPHVLLNTLIYFNTRYFMLRTAEDHIRLSFSHIMKHWKKTNVTGTRTPGRSVYLRYYAPVNAKADAKAQNRKREEVPVYEQGENVDNPLRCPVKLYEFYLSKCPESIRNRNDVFYLIPERSCVPDSPVWYSTGSLGVEAMSKMLNRVRVVREIQERHLHHQPYIS